MVRLNRQLSADPSPAASQEWDPPGDVVGGTTPLPALHVPSASTSALHATLHHPSTSTSALHVPLHKTTPDRKTTSWDDVSRRGPHSSDV